MTITDSWQTYYASIPFGANPAASGAPVSLLAANDPDARTWHTE